MKQMLGLASAIFFVIVMISSVVEIFFPLSVVASVAENVPKPGRILLWYWLAGIDRPASEFEQGDGGYYLASNPSLSEFGYEFNYNQQEVDYWLSQHIGNNTDPSLIWMNNLLFAPMDNPVFTISPAYNYEWQPPEGDGRPQFICAPLLVGGVTYMTDHYGSDNGPGVWEHTGIDYGTNGQEGLPVITPMDGVVVWASSHQGWGGSVIIQNGEYQVWLTHAIEFNVQAGDIVQAGDVVMFSGGRPGTPGAGNSSGPHLHFEIRHCPEDKDRCEIVNPNGTLLPGQDTVCFWAGQVSAPERNWAPFVSEDGFEAR